MKKLWSLPIHQGHPIVSTMCQNKVLTPPMLRLESKQQDGSSKNQPRINNRDHGQTLSISEIPPFAGKLRSGPAYTDMGLPISITRQPFLSNPTTAQSIPMESHTHQHPEWCQLTNQATWSNTSLFVCTSTTRNSHWTSSLCPARPFLILILLLHALLYH